MSSARPNDELSVLDTHSLSQTRLHQQLAFVVRPFITPLPARSNYISRFLLVGTGRWGRATKTPGGVYSMAVCGVGG